MALSVAQYAESSPFEIGGDRTIDGVAWSNTDYIVVTVPVYDGSINLTDVTNANLTFAKKSAAETGGTSESYCYCYAAVAASAQTTQTINLAFTGSGFARGGMCWVVTGGPTGFANADADFNEAAFNKTVSAGSVCIYCHSDWNVTSGKTITTGSGTATERHDAATTYGHYAGDWVDVSAGIYDFGIASYGGTKVGKVFIEVLAPGAVAGTPNSGFFGIIGS